MKLITTNEYLLLIDEEAEIKKEEYPLIVLDTYSNRLHNYLTSEWGSNASDYYQKIIAYYPLTKEAKELDLPLLPNPFENELNRSLKRAWDTIHPLDRNSFVEGYRAAQSKQFSLDSMRKAFETGRNFQLTGENNFNELIQSLSAQQLPKEFVISDKFSTFEENIKNGEYKY